MGVLVGMPRTRRLGVARPLLLAVIAAAVLAAPVRQASGFGGLTDEAVAVWQHRDPASATGWDIWYSALGRPAPTDPTSALAWHAAGGPVAQAAPIATLVGDDKNPHIGMKGSVTIAVWQHRLPGVDGAPGDWEIYYAELNRLTGAWTTPSAVAMLPGDDYDPNVTIDSTGNAFAVWVHRNPDGSRIMASSVLSGGSWGAPAFVAPTGGQASLPEVTTTSVSSVPGSQLAHKAVAGWADLKSPGIHRMFAAVFDGLAWGTPIEIESAATGIGVSISNVGFADYAGTEPDPFGSFGRTGITADPAGKVYVVWGGGPTILGFFSPGVVGAIHDVAANSWAPMLTPFGSRFIGSGGCENPDAALTTGGGDFVGVFSFAGFIEHTRRVGGAFTFEDFSYNDVLDDQRPSNAAISDQHVVSVNWGAPVGSTSDIVFSVGTLAAGGDVSWTPAGRIAPPSLAGEDMFPEIAAAFVPPPTLTGRAFVARADIEDVGTTGVVGPTTVLVEDTGDVSTQEASTVRKVGIEAAGLVSGSALEARVDTEAGALPASHAQASLGRATIAIPGGPVIEVAGVRARSDTTCGGSSGQTDIAYLAVDGTVILDGSAVPPNTPVAGAPVVLNEQAPVAGADAGLLVNAVHVVVPGVADVTMGSARSDIHDCL